MRGLNRMAVATVAAAAAALSAAGVTRAEDVACDVAAIQAKAPTTTTVTKATVVAASGEGPRHCVVDGHTVSSKNAVNFRLALPEKWNGKFLFLGVGGLGGSHAGEAKKSERSKEESTCDERRTVWDVHLGSVGKRCGGVRSVGTPVS